MNLAVLLACVGATHVWHAARTGDGPAAWCQLSRALEYDFWFTNTSGANVTDFALGRAPFVFGTSLGALADFNMMYTLTCAPLGGVGPAQPKTLFAIGVDAPGQPSLSTVNYHGAASLANYRAPVIEFLVEFT